MLPAFDDYGNLPPGIHRCAFNELAARFGTGSDEREAEVDELKTYFEIAKNAGVSRLVVDGSFVTDNPRPNDVDIVVLVPPEYDVASTTLEVDGKMWSRIHIFLALGEASFEKWACDFFAFDRLGNPKGVVEVIL